MANQLDPVVAVFELLEAGDVENALGLLAEAKAHYERVVAQGEFAQAASDLSSKAFQIARKRDPQE